MFAMIWVGNNLTVLTDELIECVKLWHADSNYGVQEIINKIFALVFLIGVMLWGIFIALKHYPSKENIVEKIKYVVALIIFEITFGFVAVMTIIGS